MLDTRKRAHGHLTPAMERAQQRALRDNCGTRLRVIERRQQISRFRILQPALHGDRALAHSRHAHFGRKNFGDSLTEPQAVQSCFRNAHRLVLAAFHFAETRVHIAAQVAQIQVRANVPQLRLAP